MKLIEGLKLQKDLQRKIDNLQAKIAKHASYSSLERPVYADATHPDDPTTQKKQVESWIQSIADTVKLISTLRLRVQYTNLVTPVTIEVGGNQVTKTIAEWIHWRRDFADILHKTYSQLTDKNLREGITTNSQGEKVQVNIVRCYNPATRDALMEEYRGMRYKVDSTLEIVNATTDMVELPALPGKAAEQEETPEAEAEA